jgi:hypothetical protein
VQAGRDVLDTARRSIDVAVAISEALNNNDSKSLQFPDQRGEI